VKVINIDKVVAYAAIVVTLIFTPVNFDALIIPKISIIFILALYILPLVLLNLKLFFKDLRLKILLVLSILILIQMIVVIINSEAPFAQELYGRTGRGLGFITFFGLTIILLVVSISSKIESGKHIVFGIVVSGLLSSSYALLQRFSLDPFNWNSRTNGIIGTLGNPNFQSSFAAMVFVPTLVFFWYKKYRIFLIPVTATLLILALYFTQSTQGYIGLSVALLVFFLAFSWFRNKYFSLFLASIGVVVSVFAIAGMLNRGPLSYWLYKISVQSRGDFWRSAFAASNDNPFLGVGIDSFGDAYLTYRDQTAFNHSFAEITDNAHNYLLEYAVTGGYPLAILHLGIILLTLFSFYNLQTKLKSFNPQLTAIFCFWVVFLLQSLVSPGTVSLILWNYIVSGFIIGANIRYSSKAEKDTQNLKINLKSNVTFGMALAILGTFIAYPLFNSDRSLLKGLNSRNANLVITALNSFPQSSVKYNIFGQEILRSNLPDQALEVAREATKFNPNAVSAWGLIFSNPNATKAERIEARDQIIRLDPLNQEVFKFDIS
jgi:O-antigen ligase